MKPIEFVKIFQRINGSGKLEADVNAFLTQNYMKGKEGKFNQMAIKRVQYTSCLDSYHNELATIVVFCEPLVNAKYFINE